MNEQVGIFVRQSALTREMPIYVGYTYILFPLIHETDIVVTIIRYRVMQTKV